MVRHTNKPAGTAKTTRAAIASSSRGSRGAGEVRCRGGEPRSVPLIVASSKTVAGSREIRGEKLAHRRPVPLGCGSIVGQVVRNGEAVLGGIFLEGVFDPGRGERLLQCRGITCGEG